MVPNFPLNLETIVGIATILGTIAAWLALWPLVSPVLKRATGNISKLADDEKTYLLSLLKDLENRNITNRWSNKFYINVETELQIRKAPYDIPPAFYVVKAINRSLKEQDFNNLSNIEKIDSSRGRTFNSLEAALGEAQDNAVIVIAPPGNGKTVSLRNLAIKFAQRRLSRKNDLIPIFINLGYYTGFSQDGSVEHFDEFLEDFFSSSGYYSFLANHAWQKYLKQSRCVFFLDGVDELPRSPVEYEIRCQRIADFVRSWPTTRFILSCRELDYNRELPFQQILIKPFDRTHIKLYMQKYFTSNEYGGIFQQLEETPGMYELCRNPFYLDIVCYFSKFLKRIPQNKAQLFGFIVDQFVERENKKQTNQVDTNQFAFAISHLAYHLAVTKMVTTIRLDEYQSLIQNDKNRDTLLAAVEFAIKGELLDYNEKTREIRFIHNRFQEFFSSLFMVEEYQKNKNLIPANFFTNLWWRETALFIAGLDKNVDNFINLILNQRDNYINSNKTIEKLLKLDITILAIECIFSNLNFNNKALYEKIRDYLFRSFSDGDTLVKAKVLDAFKQDKSPEVADLLQRAINDESLWVSERAFFMLTDGQMKIQMNIRSIIGEFLRFFIEGRIINTFIPVIKSAGKSNLIKLLLPIYFFLVATSMVSILVVAYVFYSFIVFLRFKLDWAFTAKCLQCLLTMGIGIYIIVRVFMNNNYPAIKRFLYTAPSALMVHFLVFNIPSNLIIKGVMILTGFGFWSLYGRFLKKPNESDYSTGSITAYIFGFWVLTPFLEFEMVSQTIKAYVGVSPDFQIPPIIGIGFLAVLIFVIGSYLYRQVRTLSRLNIYASETDNILKKHRDDSISVKNFTEMFNGLSILWAQKSLLKKILEKMTIDLRLSRPQKISFLHLLASTVANIHLRDAIYQSLEDEENNYRRSIKTGGANEKEEEIEPVYQKVFSGASNRNVPVAITPSIIAQENKQYTISYAKDFNLSKSLLIAFLGFTVVGLLAESNWIFGISFKDSWTTTDTWIYLFSYPIAGLVAGSTVAYVISQIIPLMKEKIFDMALGWMGAWALTRFVGIILPNTLSLNSSTIILNLMEGLIVAFLTANVIERLIGGLGRKVFLYFMLEYFLATVLFILWPNINYDVFYPRDVPIIILPTMIGNLFYVIPCYLTLKAIQIDSYYKRSVPLKKRSK